MIVTVTPNPSLDLTYLLTTDSPGLADESIEVHRAHSVHLEASGKGVNVSRALTLAGRPSPAVLFAGGDTGHQLLELLAAERVPYRTVVQAGPTRVNTTVLRPGGATTKVNAPGSAPSVVELDNLVVAVDNELVTLRKGLTGAQSPDNWLLICGSLPPGVVAETLIARLVTVAHTHGWRVAVDSSGAGLAAGLNLGADLLAPNAAELNAVRPGPPALDLEAIVVAAKEVSRERGCELLVSLGPDGALWTDGRRTLHARGPVVVPVNTAGAGDALLAGWFSAGPEVDPADRLATAVAWGAAACLSITTVAPAATGYGTPSTDSVQVVDRSTDRFGPAETDTTGTPIGAAAADPPGAPP